MFKPFRGIQINKSHPLSRELGGCWVLNEESGSICSDLSGNERHGTFTGTVNRETGGINVSNTAANYVNCGSWAPKGPIFTIEQTFKVVITGNWVVYSCFNSGGSGLWIGHNATGVLYEYTSTGSGANYSHTFTDGEIVHLVTVVDTTNSQVLCYVNGTRVSPDRATTLTIDGTPYEFNIGRSPSVYATNNSVNSFKQVKYWDRGLSDEEVKSLYLDPYQMFEPVSNIMNLIPVSSSVGQNDSRAGLQVYNKPFRGTQLNKSHPLAKNLISCVLFNEKTGDKVFDHILGNNDSIIKSGVSGTRWSPSGYKFKDDTTDDIITWDNPKQTIEGKEAFTFLMGIKCNAFQDQAQWTIGTYTPNLAVYVDGKIYIYHGSSSKTRSTNSLTLNQWHDIGYRRKGRGPGEASYFIDGVKDSDFTYSDVIPAPSPNKQSFGSDVHVSGNYAFNGELSYFYSWDRALTDEEIASIKADPYQMFETDKRVPFFPPLFSNLNVSVLTDGDYLITGVETYPDITYKIGNVLNPEATDIITDWSYFIAPSCTCQTTTNTVSAELDYAGGTTHNPLSTISIGTSTPSVNLIRERNPSSNISATTNTLSADLRYDITPSCTCQITTDTSSVDLSFNYTQNTSISATSNISDTSLLIDHYKSCNTQISTNTSSADLRYDITPSCTCQIVTNVPDASLTTYVFVSSSISITTSVPDAALTYNVYYPKSTTAKITTNTPTADLSFVITPSSLISIDTNTLSADLRYDITPSCTCQITTTVPDTDLGFLLSPSSTISAATTTTSAVLSITYLRSSTIPATTNTLSADLRYDITPSCTCQIVTNTSTTTLLHQYSPNVIMSSITNTQDASMEILQIKTNAVWFGLSF